MLSLSNVTKKYKNGFGINKITFEIKKGDFIALVGDNGAGKTTLIKTIFSELKMNTGSINLDNENVFKNKLLRNLSFFPDSNNIPVDIKVSEYVKYIARCNSIDSKEYKEDLVTLTKMFGFEKYLGKKIKHLSAGEKKKAVMLGVLITKPNYIFFDEPTANLDIDSKLEFLEILQTLKDMGLAILVTSHLIEELELLANKVIILKEGNLVYNEKFDSSKEKIIDIYIKHGRRQSGNTSKLHNLYSKRGELNE